MIEVLFKKHVKRTLLMSKYLYRSFGCQLTVTGKTQWLLSIGECVIVFTFCFQKPIIEPFCGCLSSMILVKKESISFPYYDTPRLFI